jgi:glycerol-3-phosphate dehydrogenase
VFDLNIIAGAFGTAMATVAALTGKHKIVMYTRNPEVEFCINKIRRNPMIFTEFKLEEAISATTKLDEALSDSSLIINCLPA